MSDIGDIPGSSPETADALMAWLEAFPSRQLERRLASLVQQRRDLDGEIRFLQNQILRYRQYLTDLNPPKDEEEPSAPIQAADGLPKFPPKRTAVFRLLAETPGRSLKLAEVRETLIKRGWLEDTDKARHELVEAEVEYKLTEQRASGVRCMADR